MTRTTHFPEVPSDSRQKGLPYPLIWTMLGVFVSLLGFGCTHDHKIDLNPKIFVRVSNIGKGERLVVRVKDTRSQRAISKKESNLKVTSDRAIDTVNIYASSSVRNTVLDKIMEGFQRMGFHPSKHGNNSSQVTKSHRMLTGKFKNERLVNNSLSMAIQKMFDDPELLRFLLPSKP